MFGIAEYKLDKLQEAANGLTESYKHTRMEMDQRRTLGFLRPYTQNPDRLNDIQCIKKITAYINKNKFLYRHTSSSSGYINSLYNKEIAPFLKQAIVGAFLFELLKITSIYTDDTVRGNSALGEVILDLFEIDKLSQFPKDKLTECLSSLQQFIQNMAEKEPLRQWHETMTNQQLIDNIAELLKKIVPFPAAESSWWASIGFTS